MMTLDAYIERLTQLRQTHGGDIRVGTFHGGTGAWHDAADPVAVQGEKHLLEDLGVKKIIKVS